MSLQQWEFKPDGSCVCAKRSEISTQTATVEEKRNTGDAMRADRPSKLSPRQVSWASGLIHNTCGSLLAAAFCILLVLMTLPEI